MRRRNRRKQPIRQSHITSPILMVMLLLAVPVLAVVNIILSAQVSDLGFRIDELNTTKEVLLDQNHDLEQEIFKVSALTKIQKQAEEMGFESDNEYVSIEQPLPVASSQE